MIENELLNRSVYLPEKLQGSFLGTQIPIHPIAQMNRQTKRVLACFIRLSKSRYSRPAGKDHEQTPILRDGGGKSSANRVLHFLSNSTHRFLSFTLAHAKQSVRFALS